MLSKAAAGRAVVAAVGGWMGGGGTKQCKGREILGDSSSFQVRPSFIFGFGKRSNLKKIPILKTSKAQFSHETQHTQRQRRSPPHADRFG